MSIYVNDRKWLKNNGFIVTYMVDTESDIASLPIDVLPTSQALVIDTSDIYVFNGKSWVKL